MSDEEFPATVVKVVNPWRVVINRGSAHRVKIGQRFLIYSITSEAIIDPKTGESLGFLENPKGTGKVINVQEKISTLESDTPMPSEIGGGFDWPTLTTRPPRMMPFEDVEPRDLAKPI